jgi:hypothetical protein
MDHPITQAQWSPDYPIFRFIRRAVLSKADRMNHSEGLNSIETALAYVEQQREATATDVLLFGRWRDLAAKKRKEAQKQIPKTNFLKKETLSFTNLHHVK